MPASRSVAYVAESILVPGAYAAPGYVSGMMQPPRGLTPLQIEDLVSYLIGKPWTRLAGRPVAAARKPIAACDAKASCRATVARWAKARAASRCGARRCEDHCDLRLSLLPPVRGQRCQEWLGAGSDACGPDEGDGRRARKAPGMPACVRAGSAMPSYAALGDANLRRVAETLRA